MDNFIKINSKKVSRKRFFLISAVSVAAAYSFLKMPFKLLFNKKEKTITQKGSVNVKVNPDAVCRNSRGQNA